MTRRDQKRWKRSLTTSLVLHGGVLLLALVLPLFAKGCAERKPPQKLMFVDFTVAVPPAAPDSAPPEPDPPPPAPPSPIPEPPPPQDNIPEPEKKTDKNPELPKPSEAAKPKPKPHTVIKQTNRVVRGPTPTPQPKEPVLSDKEIADLLKKGAKIGTTTSNPDDAAEQALGAYSNHVRDRLYAAWQQPESLKNIPGLVTKVQITIQQDGRVGNGKILESSGNAVMDESVLKAVRTVKAMRALPNGVKGPRDLEIAFELTTD